MLSEETACNQCVCVVMTAYNFNTALFNLCISLHWQPALYYPNSLPFTLTTPAEIIIQDFYFSLYKVTHRNLNHVHVVSCKLRHKKFRFRVVWPMQIHISLWVCLAFLTYTYLYSIMQYFMNLELEIIEW